MEILLNRNFMKPLDAVLFVEQLLFVGDSLNNYSRDCIREFIKTNNCIFCLKHVPRSTQLCISMNFALIDSTANGDSGSIDDINQHFIRQPQ